MSAFLDELAARLTEGGIAFTWNDDRMREMTIEAETYLERPERDSLVVDESPLVCCWFHTGGEWWLPDHSEPIYPKSPISRAIAIAHALSADRVAP